MEREGEAINGPALRRARWACAIRCVGASATGAAIVLLAPAAAQASDDRGPLGNLLGHVTNTVGQVADPLLDPVNDIVGSVPVVGPVLGHIGATNPISSITQPVTGAVDGLIGGTVGSLPLVGPLVGTTPTGSLIAPVAETVGGVVSGGSGTSPAVPGAPDGGALPGSGQQPVIAPGATTDTESFGEQLRAWIDDHARAHDAAQTTASSAQHNDVIRSATVPDPHGMTPFNEPQDVPATAVPSGWTSTLTIPLGAYADVVFAALIVVLLLGVTVLTRSRGPPRRVGELDSSPD